MQLIQACGGSSGGGSVGAWAVAWFDHAAGDAYQSIPSGGNPNVPFAHFETTDQTVFSTSPAGAAGDSIMHLAGPGVYIAEMGMQWQNNFAALVESDVTFQSFHGPNWFHRAAGGINNAPGGAFGVYQEASWSVYPFTAADLAGGPAELVVQVGQESGIAQNLAQMYLRVAYLPTLTSSTVVY